MTVFASLSLFAATIVFAVTPGPGTLAVLSRGLALGLWPAFILGVGLVIGDLIYLWAAMLSLGLIAEQASMAFDWVRYLGGGYLLVLGIQAWRSPPPVLSEPARATDGWMKSLIGGCAISCTNPKVILFYLGFLPLFLNLAELELADMLWVSLVIVSALLLVLFAISFGAHRLRPLLSRGNLGIWLNRVSGAVMAGVGILVATS